MADAKIVQHGSIEIQSSVAPTLEFVVVF